MKEINLRDYYPFYTQDVIVEVPDEVRCSFVNIFFWKKHTGFVHTATKHFTLWIVMKVLNVR